MSIAAIKAAFSIYSAAAESFDRFRLDGLTNRVYVRKDDGRWERCSKMAVHAELERILATRWGDQPRVPVLASGVVVNIILRQFCLEDGFSMRLRRSKASGSFSRDPFSSF